MSSAGFRRFGVECQNCHEAFAIQLDAMNKPSLDKLPEPFPAKCPHCGEENLYARSVISPLVSVGHR